MTEPLTAHRQRSGEPAASLEAGFNLIDDPWIPVRYMTGRRQKVSIRQMLTDAHRLDGWFSGETLFVPAMARLATAFMYRLIEGIDTQSSPQAVLAARGDALNAGRCDPDKLSDYCDTHRDSFWLMPPHGNDAVGRFGQDARLGRFCADNPEARLIKPLTATKLSMHAAPSYVWDNQTVGSIPLDAAARHLLMFLHYAPGGIPDGVHPDAPTKPKRPMWQAGRLRNTVSVHPCGRSLYETLVSHVLPAAHPFPDGLGVPAWEQPDIASVLQPLQAPRTLLEQITGRFTHSVWLFCDETGRVDRAAAATGRRRVGEEHDPYTARCWRKGTGRDAAPVLRPLRAFEGRSMWRDLESLMVRHAKGAAAAAAGETPVVRFAPPSTLRWVLCAHRCDRSKEVAWHESTLPAAVLIDTAAWQRSTVFVAEAEQCAAVLEKQAKSFAVQAGTKPDALRSLALNHYWSAMEQHFPTAATQQASTSDAAEIPATLARNAFDAASATVSDRLATRARRPAGIAEPLVAVRASCRSKIRGPGRRAAYAAKKRPPATASR